MSSAVLNCPVAALHRKLERVISSCPAQAGKGDRALARWKGRGPQRSFCADNELHLRGPLHHATRGPPPPLRGGGCKAIPLSRRDLRASFVKQRCRTARTPRRSPDERSDIRERSRSFTVHPGFRFAHPGYEKIKEAERRQTRVTPPARKRRAGRATEGAACAALSALGRARLPAFHHGSRQGDLRHPRRNPGHASWDAV